MEVKDIAAAVEEMKSAAFEKINKIDGDVTKIAKQLGDLMLAAQRPSGADKGELTADEREHKSAFDAFLRKGETAGLADIQRKAMSSTSDPDGGYLVLPQMEKEIDRIAPTMSAMHRLARVVTIGSKAWLKRVKKTGMSMRRVAEGSGGGETTEPTFAQIEVPVHTAEVEPWVNNETLEDADVDLAADLAEEAGIAFAEGGGDEFINGNGVGKARGILSYDVIANSSYTWGKIGYVITGKSAAFASVAPADDIIDLQHALKPKYRQGAVWLMNDATLGVIRQMKDASGNYYLFQPDPTGKFVGRLLGHPGRDRRQHAGHRGE
jgi:HK97 family phage major capsid protein